MSDFHLPPQAPFGPLSLAHYTRRPFDWFEKQRARFGDTFWINGFDGPLVITGDPEHARIVFSTGPDELEMYAPDFLKPVTGSESLIVLAGDAHRRRRQVVMPPFHGERMKAYREILIGLVEARAATWRVGQRLRMQDELGHIAMAAMVRAVLGVNEGAKFSLWMEALGKVSERFTSSVLFFRFLQHRFFGLGPWARLQRAIDRSDALIYRELAERRGGSGDDILSLLLLARYEDGAPMSDAEIRDELMGLLVAGFESTTSALAWGSYWLTWHPEYADRVAQETAEDTPFLGAFCQEVLRHRPIVVDIFRRCKGPFMLGELRLPAKMGISISLALLHSHPRLYPEPKRFRPERFLERKFAPHEFAPFGGGHRRCIGAAFAMFEMKIILAELFSHHRFTPGSGRVRSARRNLVLGPDNAVPVIYQGRR